MATSDMRDEEWETLLVAGQRGDADAYRRFLTAILPFARSLARRKLWSDALVEDVVQDALLTIHRVRHSYEPGRPVKPWLAAIVSRRAIDAMRRHGRSAGREINDDAAYETFADERANQSETGDDAATLSHMMSGLTPVQKEALELVKLKEMSLVEASAVSGQSVAALKVNIHRAIKKMRRGLDAE
ncbi:MAG: sigma-70 family RNA polymerase sigma factor [Pseudomonadota bacterium]|nr:sigma-70 family RNA polymerase sigma factor [Pseudomonadota bacterium]